MKTYFLLRKRKRKRMSEQKDFGFEIKLSKPIEEMTDEEVDNLDSDCSILEREVEKLREIVDKEFEKRDL